jgi:pyrroloquinoline quinone biosynthesis protein D
VRLHYDRLGGRQVLLFPEGILHLNPTAASILSLCDGRRNVGEIAAALAATFEAPPEALLADVGEYLFRLCDQQLLYLWSEEASR